ncbi:tryptophan halogenase [Shewanella sp. OPT22]|nr:tryptophan halogenase [Shewanella sp. OPT22]
MKKITSVAILGGGSAGWMSAAMLSKLMPNIEITLVESKDIGTIGVGEASIPPLTLFNQTLGINETEFMRETQASIKLGIQFENWNQQGDSYMHAFGALGKDLGFTQFHHYWLKSQQKAETFWDYSFNYQAAKSGKYNLVNQIPNTNLPGLEHAYHFDAGLYANYLSNLAIRAGVTRVEGLVKAATLVKDSGNVKSIQLSDGSEIETDLFIDCSGQHAFLIEKVLGTGYEDWSHFLPCDRALAVPSEKLDSTLPYTKSIAHDTGWQWQIPLQHRIGNGLVYSSRYLADEDAKALLLESLPSKPVAEPKLIKFKVGRRLKQWNKNCISIGLSSGFLEPLESTSIHLIQSAIMRLIKLFPQTDAFEFARKEFNKQSAYEFNHIRDFIILHYYLNNKSAPFWKHCRQMDIPENLKDKIELFKETAEVSRNPEDLFAHTAWQQVMIGQGTVPNKYHPIADNLTKQQLSDFLNDLSSIYQKCSKALPTHDEFLQHYCSKG